MREFLLTVFFCLNYFVFFFLALPFFIVKDTFTILLGSLQAPFFFLLFFFFGTTRPRHVGVS